MAKTKSGSNKKFASMKRMISLKDARIKHNQQKPKKKKIDKSDIIVRDAPQTSSALFFTYNTQLGPPYRVLLDTNFIHFSVKNKVDLFKGLMDCLYAKCIPYVTDCVFGELEKLGSKFRVALKILKDSRIERLSCLHKGTYADDCLVQHVTQHKCYIVGTCDKDLKRRIRKIPGVPIMFLRKGGYSIERMPDAYGAPRV